MAFNLIIMVSDFLNIVIYFNYEIIYMHKMYLLLAYIRTMTYYIIITTN